MPLLDSFKTFWILFPISLFPLCFLKTLFVIVLQVQSKILPGFVDSLVVRSVTKIIFKIELRFHTREVNNVLVSFMFYY